MPKYGEMYFPFLSSSESDLRVSFEFFPPKTEKMEETLWHSVEQLSPLNPEFVSVTYGAGGTTRERTHDIVTKIHNDKDLNVAAHLTCVGASRGEIDDIARRYWDEGIKHIVALRGDLPEGYGHHSDGYKYANELVEGLKKIADFEISVAGYPEKHPEAETMEQDLENLKRKVDCGADRVMSQFFVDPENFLRFRDMAQEIGINVPIVPGILPITNFSSTVKFSKMCGTNMPAWMSELFEGLDGHPHTRELVAVNLVSEQCRVLYENGVKDFHFYTLNRAELSLAICHVLGIRAKTA